MTGYLCVQLLPEGIMLFGAFPGFIARSRTHSAQDHTDTIVWHEMWEEARDYLATSEDPSFNRWSKDHPACA